MNETDFITLTPTEGGAFAAFQQRQAFAAFQRELEERRTRIPTPPAEKWHALCDDDAARLADITVDCMRRICDRRASSESSGDQVDFAFWHELTIDLLTNNSTVNILAIPAGSGKSTWLEAFLVAVGGLIQSEDPLANKLGGILVVKERVEDLNRLRDSIPQYRDGSDIFVPIQSLSRSGMERGLCLAQSAGPCVPTNCQHAGICELRRFRDDAQFAPILGITQAMLGKLRSEEKLESALRWTPEREDDGNRQTIPRALILFDEKYTLNPTDSINLHSFNAVKDQFEQLSKDGRISDRQAQFYEMNLLWKLETVFQIKRRELNRETADGRRDKTFSTIRLKQDEITKYLEKFGNLRDQLQESQRFSLSPEMRQVLAVFTRLYAGDECLASHAGENFTIFGGNSALVEFQDAKTVIFDATAVIDEDYAPIREVARIYEQRPQRTAHEIVFHIYPDKRCNVSRSAYKGSRWKIHALAKFVRGIMEQNPGKFLLLTYKDYAEELTENLDADLLSRIPLMRHPETEAMSIPYLGGTHGSNAFNDCDAVIFLGYPRLNGQEYLQRTIAAYGTEQILSEVRELDPASIDGSFTGDPLSLPSVKQYIAHHLAAEIEQAIFRGKHRNPGCGSTVDVYFLYPNEAMMQILRERFPEAEIRNEETPVGFGEAPAKSRLYDGTLAARGRLLNFIEDEQRWMKTPIMLVSEIKNELKISDSVWKDLISDGQIRSALARNHITRTGGRFARWIRENTDAA